PTTGSPRKSHVHRAAPRAVLPDGPRRHHPALGHVPHSHSTVHHGRWRVGGRPRARRQFIHPRPRRPGSHPLDLRHRRGRVQLVGGASGDGYGGGAAAHPAGAEHLHHIQVHHRHLTLTTPSLL